MNEKPITILYHSKCPDGFGGAYAAWKKFGDTAEYIPLRYGKPIPQHMEGREIYFIDFCYGKEHMDEFVKIASSVTVLDHHEGMEDVATTLHGVFDPSRSGATIAWKYFHPNTPEPFLFKYLEDYDLFRFSFPDTKAINAYITLEPYTFERWDEIIAELDNPKTRDNIINRGRIYAQHTDALIEHISGSADLVEFEGYTCYLSATVMQEFTNYLGHTLATKQPPFALMVRPTADGLHVSLRSVDGFDTTILVRRYGGNGHPGASAFRIPWGAPIPWKPAEKEEEDENTRH